MRIFLSHAAHDGPLATYLAEALGPSLGLSFFKLPDDAPPGLPWIEQIRSGAAECDALWSIISPESIRRPWISAEWAAFWLQDKPTTPLLVDIGMDELWEPMRAYQTVALGDPSSVMRFLRQLSDESGIEPAAGVRPLTNEIVREVPRVRSRQAVRSLEDVFGRLARNLTSGTDNINPDDVKSLVFHDRLAELLQLSISPNASPVKQRQVAVALVAAGRVGEAVAIAEHIPNRAEIRTLGRKIVTNIPRGAVEASEEWQALDRVYELIGPAQRKNLLDFMETIGIAPLGKWASYALGAEPSGLES